MPSEIRFQVGAKYLDKKHLAEVLNLGGATKLTMVPIVDRKFDIEVVVKRKNKKSLKKTTNSESKNEKNSDGDLESSTFDPSSSTDSEVESEETQQKKEDCDSKKTKEFKTGSKTAVTSKSAKPEKEKESETQTPMVTVAASSSSSVIAISAGVATPDVSASVGTKSNDDQKGSPYQEAGRITITIFGKMMNIMFGNSK